MALKAWSLRIQVAMVCLAVTAIPDRIQGETRTLTNAWSFLIGYATESSPALGEDGTIYLGLWNGDFRAFQPDGSPKWVFHGPREIKSSPAVGADGTIYFGSRDRRLYALTPDGKKKWDFATAGWIDSSPGLAKDGTIYFGSWDKNFYAVNPDGTKRWHFSTAGEIVSSPSISVEGAVYFGSHDGKFYALNPSGTECWQYATGGPIISSPAIGNQGTLYFSSVDGSFYALDGHGTLKWRLKTGGVTESSPIIGHDGTIYIGVNTTLWAISPEGKKLWEQSCGGDLIDASPLALEDDTVCIVSRAGFLVNLRTPNQFNWVFDQKWYGAISPTIGKDGTIYTVKNVVGTGILLCALESNVKLAQSPWPKFHGDVRGTGRANAEAH